jgi:hypothetical protein
MITELLASCITEIVQSPYGNYSITTALDVISKFYFMNNL